MSRAYIKLPKLPPAPEPTKAKEVWLYEHHCVSTHFPTPAERAEARAKTAWSDDEEQELINLYNKGLTYLQIAYDMERTEGSVRHKIRLLVDEGRIKGRYKQ